MSHTLAASPLGELTLVFDGDVLTGLYFPGHWYRPDSRPFGEFVVDGVPAVRHQLAEYFAGKRTEFDVPVRATGDEFQQRVWKLIERIPHGGTATYGEMAAELGDPALARDVGAAVGRNPLCIVIPCHRVVGKDGKLTGYAGGLARKRFLLELEDDDAGRLF
jgi:methylated-DNA-[protein]-cysteine S-methyltransferase